MASMGTSADVRANGAAYDHPSKLHPCPPYGTCSHISLTILYQALAINWQYPFKIL
jgi:hypothetical protein